MAAKPKWCISALRGRSVRWAGNTSAALSDGRRQKGRVGRRDDGQVLTGEREAGDVKDERGWGGLGRCTKVSTAFRFHLFTGISFTRSNLSLPCLIFMELGQVSELR
ncbi:hypothetical protein E2C01_100693 [Portunus trituberculatus]|uniref:Uncharacterized protein n=1 Tax=Portunus trituberculatus TaxID=210409 RepID=A0A5B7KI81_PORTR|nr:hypothetical protein [Portunus trituberculatus]